MEYTANRIVELVESITWHPGRVLRIFWVRHSLESRQALAVEISRVVGTEAIVPLIVREGFENANAVMSDVQKAFSANRNAFDCCQGKHVERVSVILLAKEDFKLPQGASPVILPQWFPVKAGHETFFEIADLAMTAEAALLDCPEARIEQIAEFTYKLEAELVARLASLQLSEPARVRQFVAAAHGGGAEPDALASVSDYQQELGKTIDPRAYRPNAAKEAKSLISRLLKLVLHNPPKQLGVVASQLADCFTDSSYVTLKPTLFAVMSRPAAKMNVEAANWHSILLAFYQSYQLMNGAAHAGEYPHYSVSLQFVSSVDLRSFLFAARSYVGGLT
ncbi:hypothetical protein [Paraburkholderia caribensis]|uniref:hypothetical protein n=1 Tax=Paraburkholderia caribensis TaxID=75105 RepID=UPI001CAB9907|nr:hypothetical protein [Paraburkholderia caribensis]CAG9243710.1 conserved hypothetical protein [Paraburkholderia caribensis]